MNKNILYLVVGIAILGGTVMWWTGQKNKPTTSGLETSTNSASEVVAITYTENGFSPSIVNIKAGNKLKVINSSGRSIDFASNPHPIHTDMLELNFGVIKPGESKTAPLTKKGEWRYHDHFNASAGGKISVF